MMRFASLTTSYGALSNDLLAKRGSDELMGRKKKPKIDNPEQYARFVETAERIQDEDADEKFEEAMKRILRAKQKEDKDAETPFSS
jgi:hypothetical protein